MLPPSLSLIRKGLRMAFMPGMGFVLKIISSFGLMLYITKYIGIEQNKLQTNLLDLLNLPYIREIVIISMLHLLTNSIVVSFVIPSLYIVLKLAYPHISSINKLLNVKILHDNIINIILITIIGLTILYIHKKKVLFISGPMIGIGLFVISLLFPNIVSMEKAKSAIENVLAKADI